VDPGASQVTCFEAPTAPGTKLTRNTTIWGSVA
jgi:hypothetical protein